MQMFSFLPCCELDATLQHSKQCFQSEIDRGTHTVQDSMRGVGRSLQQGERVTVVETADALQRAVVAGMTHIEIQSHLDLTRLKGPEGTFSILGGIPGTVKSIRVRRCLDVLGLLLSLIHI